MLIQKLQLPKIPDSLETALEYKGVERWVCWYWDDEGTLLIEDINSSYFGNSQAWLLFCSYVDNNPHLEFKGSAYEHFESLMSTQYPYKEGDEAETQVTGNLSLSNNAYLFDRQSRELYSGSATDIQTLIKQPKTLVMWAELQGQTSNNISFGEELSLLKLTIEDWALTETLTEPKPQNKLLNTAFFKLVVVWFGFALILPVPWASAMHLIKSVGSHFPFVHSTDSIEKLKADLALENQTADLFGKKETLEGSKKQKSECKTHTD